MAKKKIKINRETCIGCGVCQSLCPKLFRMSGNKAEQIGELDSEEAVNCALEAEASCPTGAIEIYDEEDISEPESDRQRKIS